jgi:hypothetical protein
MTLVYTVEHTSLERERERAHAVTAIACIRYRGDEDFYIQHFVSTRWILYTCCNIVRTLELATTKKYTKSQPHCTHRAFPT